MCFADPFSGLLQPPADTLCTRSTRPSRVRSSTDFITARRWPGSDLTRVGVLWRAASSTRPAATAVEEWLRGVNLGRCEYSNGLLSSRDRAAAIYLHDIPDTRCCL